MVNAIYSDGDSFSTFSAFFPTQPEETYSMVTANRFWSQIFGVAFSNKRRLHSFMLFIPLAGLWTCSIGIIRLAFNIREYDFVSQELKAAEHTEFETLYTKNILLNEEIQLWMAVQDRPMRTFSSQKKYYLEETLYKRTKFVKPPIGIGETSKTFYFEGEFAFNTQ